MNAGGDGPKSLYAVWNRNYKAVFVVADSPDEALAACLDSGHIRKAHMFRKYEDVTERYTAAGAPGSASMTALLAAGSSGIAVQSDDGTWTFA